jgi:hypothetical protein
MEIRSITFFDHPGFPPDRERLEKARAFQNLAREEISRAGYQVQTTRYASPPFPHLLPDLDPKTALPYAQELEDRLGEAGFDYLSLGPALPENPGSYPLVPEIIKGTRHVFVSGIMAAPGGPVVLPAVRYCGEIIQQLSTADDRGFSNLYFAALANVPAGAPFFPAAYHQLQSPPGFALAVEGADLAVEAFSSAKVPEQARKGLIQTLEEQSRALSGAAERIQEQTGVKYSGIDYSLAPFPEEKRSLGAALEKLGVLLGHRGSLAAAAFLADTIDRADFPRAGFSGLMLPVLEDASLARRAAEGALTVRDLLLYAAVCGTGLDTLPLPGDLSSGQLNALLLDLAALAARLDKPLTARLMPIPGKKAGDPTEFDFPYFANSRVMAVQSRTLEGPLRSGTDLDLQPRPGSQEQ